MSYGALLEKHTMTPKLRLREEERKALLSWILKFCWPGILHMIKSTAMIEAPSVQAAEELTS
jgi:hypothetical protein